MNALIADPAELELRPEAAKAPEAVMAEPTPASILEPIRVRESTLTPVMERILQFRPSSHWGINE
jgi:hypothetical protein